MNADPNGQRWKGQTETSIAGLAKGVDALHARLDALPCHDCAAALSSVKLLWKFVLVALAACLALTAVLLAAPDRRAERPHGTQDARGAMTRAVP